MRITWTVGRNRVVLAPPAADITVVPAAAMFDFRLAFQIWSTALNALRKRYLPDAPVSANQVETH